MHRTFSLRGHKAPISSFGSFENHLVSGDRDGYVIVWDTTRKRPAALWKAHNGLVVSIQATNLGLLTQGRDSAIRIWKPPFINVGSDVSVLTSAHRKTESNSAVDEDSLTKSLTGPPSFEIPVNSLNFCNVAFCNGLLATPGTRDSENFDVYRILDSLSLLRVVENYGLSITEVSDGDKRAGAGIVMRLLFVDDSLLFVGYESGRVCGFRLKNDVVSTLTKNDRLVLNKGVKVTKVMDVPGHTPQPVLSMEYDSSTKTLYTGSASKKLLVYSIEHLVGGDDGTKANNEDTAEIGAKSYNLHHYGIQGLQLAGDKVAAGFWDGVVLVLDKHLNVISSVERSEESIRPEHGNDIAQDTKKSLCIHIWNPASAPESEPQSRKSLVRRRKVQTDTTLFVGYGDGLISAYSLI